MSYAVKNKASPYLYRRNAMGGTGEIELMVLEQFSTAWVRTLGGIVMVSRQMLIAGMITVIMVFAGTLTLFSASLYDDSNESSVARPGH